MATTESFHLREPLLTPITLRSSFITPKLKNYMRLSLGHPFNNYHHLDKKRAYEIEFFNKKIKTYC